MRHKTLKRLCLALAVLVVLVAVLHRPILFRLTRYFIARAAEKQDLELSYQISGSIFTNLRITGLKATPTESGPVERLKVGSVRLEYSFWGLLRKGLPGFLESAALADVQVVIDPAKSLPPQKAQQTQSIKFPALIPEKLSIHNLDFTSRQPGEDLVIDDFNLLLDPQGEGFLKAARIQIPAFQTWKDFAAKATYRSRDLALENFSFGPQVQVSRLNLDMSKLGEDVLAFGFSGTLFGGSVNASGKVTNLNETNALTLEAESKSNSLAAASTYFAFEPPLTGTLAELSLSLTGEAATPATWSGKASLRVKDLVVKRQAALDLATVQVQLGDGKAVVRSFELAQGKNRITGTAEIQLPETFSGFAKLDATGTLDADLQNLATISEGAATGAATAKGTFELKDGQPSTDLRVKADHATYGKNEVNDANLRLQLGKTAAP